MKSGLFHLGLIFCSIFLPNSLAFRQVSVPSRQFQNAGMSKVQKYHQPLPLSSGARNRKTELKMSDSAAEKKKGIFNRVCFYRLVCVKTWWYCITFRSDSFFLISFWHVAYNQIKSALPPAEERKKLVPLALMFFCILFNYTILRDTKDVLMVTSSGAEVIPFIKTYVNLPTAIVS